MSVRLKQLLERYHAKHAALQALAPWHALVEELHSPTTWLGKRFSEIMFRPNPLWRWPKQPGMASLDYYPNCGLRLVGGVVPGRDGGFIRNGDWGQLGWITDPEGCVSKNGDGLIWGVVLQLPAHKNTMRFVAGYCIGGDGGGLVVDLQHIYTHYMGKPRLHVEHGDCEAAHEAARAADSMAERAADEEREWTERQREENDGWA